MFALLYRYVSVWAFNYALFSHAEWLRWTGESAVTRKTLLRRHVQPWVMSLCFASPVWLAVTFQPETTLSHIESRPGFFCRKNKPSHEAWHMTQTLMQKRLNCTEAINLFQTNKVSNYILFICPPLTRARLFHRAATMLLHSTSAPPGIVLMSQ